MPIDFDVEPTMVKLNDVACKSCKNALENPITAICNAHKVKPAFVYQGIPCSRYEEKDKE